MDTPSSTPHPLPRLRVPRGSPSKRLESSDSASFASSSQAGPSRLPDLTQLVDLNLSDIRASHNLTDEDEDEDQYPTPKMNNAASLSSTTTTPAPSALKPAERLRALLNLVPNGSGTPAPTTQQRPASPGFLESDFEATGSDATTPSVARESLRNIFSKALREPGDTPQKKRQRRNSDSIGEYDASPGVSRPSSYIRGKRKSLSDEEMESQIRSTDSRLDSFSGRSILQRSRETNAVGFPLKSITADDSDDGDDSEAPSRPKPSNSTDTAMPSLPLTPTSQFPQHSNLLDQDSEMQRAFNEYESSDEPSHHASKPRNRSSDQTPHPSMSTATPGTPTKSPIYEKSRIPRAERKSLDSHAASRLGLGTPSTKLSPRNGHHAEHDSQFGRTPAQRRVSNHESTPEETHPSLRKMSTPLTKHKSSSSLQFSDHSSSMSLSDYTERLKEQENERNREREREWNRPPAKTTRPSGTPHIHSPHHHHSRTSSISDMDSSRPTSALSNVSIESPQSQRARVRTLSGLSNDGPRRPRLSNSRPDSAMSNKSSMPDFPYGLRRHSSSFSSGASSPSGSRGNNSQGEEIQVEIEHERERNWNAPRPKWHRRSLVTASKTSSHAPSPDPRQRAESMKSPPALKDASNASRTSIPRTSPSWVQSSKSKAVPASPSPSPSPSTERKRTSSLTHLSSPGSRSSLAYTSTPARPRTPLKPSTQSRSHLTPQVGHGRTVSPIPSDREEPDETPQASRADSTLTFPQGKRASMEHPGDVHEISEESFSLPASSSTYQATPAQHNVNLRTTSIVRNNETMGTMDMSLDDDPLIAGERTPMLTTTIPPDDSAPQGSSFPPEETFENTAQTDEDILPPSPNIHPIHSPEISAPLSLPSFLSTPPRSFSNSVKPEFQTPPPPKGLPELPEPPLSTSGDEMEESVPQWNVTPGIEVVNGNGNMTILPTPKPPGAWMVTPAPTTAGRPTELDSLTNGFESSTEGQIAAPHFHSQSTVSHTPAPPGGWMKTPGAARQRALSVPQDPSSFLNDEGAITPRVNGKEKANTLPTSSRVPGTSEPANTPVARKSILKVRFDPEVTGPLSESSDVLPHDLLNRPQPNGAIASGGRPTTPETTVPVTPPSRSPRKHRKSPSIRVVDAYGNEQKNEKSEGDRTIQAPIAVTPRSKSGVRIVDAMGREVKEEQEAPVQDRDEEAISGPVSHVAVIQRVRQGIQELVEGIESLDQTDPRTADDSTRIQELKETSRTSRESRGRLVKDVQSAEADLRRQVQGKVISSSPFRIARNPWFLFVVGMLQAMLLFVMYRSSFLRAKKMFFTSYYDPFNPDLFLYTTNPNTQYSAPSTSWNLVAKAVWHGDFTTFAEAFRDNLSILIKGWHQQVWDVWGDDPNRPIGTWPT